MKQSMVDYINTICERDFLLLKEIIDHKFRKFRSFYWLLKDQSERICEIHYDNETDINTLRISLSVSGKSMDELVVYLSENVDEDEKDHIKIFNTDPLVCIEIYKEEEQPIPDEESSDEEDEAQKTTN